MFGDTGKVAAALSAAVVYQFAIVTVITVDTDQKVHQHFLNWLSDFLQVSVFNNNQSNKDSRLLFVGLK